MDIKIFTYGDAKGAGMGLAGVLSVQKNEKITRTVPILKSNATQFSFTFFFSTMDIQIFLKGEQGWVELFFYILLYYFINVMIKTLCISSFIVVYITYFTPS